MSYFEFIQSITNELAQRIRHYAGGMLVAVVHNYQGNEIAIIWANANTGATELYRFSVVDGDTYTENVNNGHDYTSYGLDFINNVYQQMILVESQQTGRPPAF